MRRPIPDPPSAPAEALKWALVTRRQVARLQDSGNALLARDPSDASEREVLLSYCEGDAHFLLIAARHMAKALLGLEQYQQHQPKPEQVALPPDLSKDVKRLRDCFEHWEQHNAAFATKGHKGSALREHYERLPFVPPTQQTWMEDDILLGGTISVADLDRCAQSTYETVTRLRDAGAFSILPLWRPEDGLLADLTTDELS